MRQPGSAINTRHDGKSAAKPHKGNHTGTNSKEHEPSNWAGNLAIRPVRASIDIGTSRTPAFSTLCMTTTFPAIRPDHSLSDPLKAKHVSQPKMTKTEHLVTSIVAENIEKSRAHRARLHQPVTEISTFTPTCDRV